MTDYIIHAPSRSILLPKSKQELVLALPKSRLASFGGKTVVQVKHDEENTLALREAGIEVPSPFSVYYKPPKYQGKYDPMVHQSLGAEFHTLNPRSFNLSEARTGKTFTMSMAFHYLFKTGQVDKMIVFSTLSTMDSVWMQSLFETFHDISAVSVHASSAAARRDILSNDVEAYIVNHDGCKILEKELLEMVAKHRCYIIWDEADNLCNAQNDMWKSFNKIAKGAKYLNLATATPTGEMKPTDAWGLAKIVSPNNVPKYWGEFRRQTMVQVSTFRWIPKPEATALVHKALQPAFCVRKADVIDLPHLHVDRKQCELSDAQFKMYREMKNKLATEINDTKLLAVNGADVLGKCLQILLGVFKKDDGEYEVIDCQPRLDAILECIEATDKKAIVFCGYTGALRHYTKEIGKKHSVVMVDGSVGKKERDKLFKQFAAKDGPRVLCAHQKVCSHGLEFGANCDTIIWAGPIHSGKLFTQANERIASVLQKSDMKLWYVGANKFEWSLFDKLEAKRNMQSDILDLCKVVLAD